MKAEDWIDVDDRLPEENKYVLVLFKDYDQLLPQICKLVRDVRNDVVWVDRHYCHYDICWSVSWMPIVLPKEERL